MNRSNSYVQLSLLSVTVLLFGMFIFSNVYAQETVSITTSISPITILFDEFISLLDTSTTGNLTSISVTANLPCNSSNVPLLTIVAGILGNTTNIIDSSSDFIGNGPRDTCVFRDNITNVTEANIPAINSIFLNHTGSSPVHIPQGVMVTLSGLFGNQTISESTSSPTILEPDFEDDFNTDDWTTIGTGITIDDSTNERLDFSENTATTDTIIYDLGLGTSETEWVLRGHLHITTVTQGSDPFDTPIYFGLSDSDESFDCSDTQDFIGFGIEITSTTGWIRGYESDGGTCNQAGAVLENAESSDDWYFEVIRNTGNLATFTLYTDSDYSTVSTTNTLPGLSSSTDNLRYLKVATRSVTSQDSTLIGYIDDIKFYNDVTSIP